jgi:alginate O-acetyltransferase complex protein AlgI
LVAAAYWLAPGRARLWVVLVASCVFYGFWKIEFLPLLLFSAVIDYYLALRIDCTELETRRRWLLYISIAINLSILFFFKYFLFVRNSAFSLAEMLGYHPTFVEISIILPLGVSFYIFATISYVIDVYRREFPAERDLLTYVCFVVYFPHLVAGPILRARSLIPQLRRPALVNLDQATRGIARIVGGLFLKVVLADPIGGLVDQAYAREPASLTGLDSWTMAFLFGCQIYFDFAGYSHIAIGSSLLMGIRLPENFNFPYVSKSPREFWRRWHISLSTWIRDYVYLPLAHSYRKDDCAINTNTAGSFVSAKAVSVLAEGATAPQPGFPREQRTLPLFMTWAVMGFWHGANWTFAVWGLYHATVVFLHRKISSALAARGLAVSSMVAWGATLAAIMAGWVPFRATSLSAALTMWGSMINPMKLAGLTLMPVTYVTAAAMFMLLPCGYWVDHFVSRLDGERSTIPFAALAAYYAVALFAVVVFLRVTSQFIYFQF